MMSLSAVCLGHTFCVSRRGGDKRKWVKTALRCLGSAVERPWLTLHMSGPFLSYLEQLGLENGLLALWYLDFWH